MRQIRRFIVKSYSAQYSLKLNNTVCTAHSCSSSADNLIKEGMKSGLFETAPYPCTLTQYPLPCLVCTRFPIWANILLKAKGVQSCRAAGC